MTARQPYWADIERAGCDEEDGGCGAKPGDPCRSPNGVKRAPHAPRRNAAADAGLYNPGESQPARTGAGG